MILKVLLYIYIFQIHLKEEKKKTEDLGTASSIHYTTLVLHSQTITDTSVIIGRCH